MYTQNIFYRTCAGTLIKAARNKTTVATNHDVERDRPGAEQVNHPLLAPAPIGISGIEAAEVTTPEYDLVVIGSGPAGQKGAIAAAKERKSVAVIDRIGMIGGVSVHTGTIPSKTIREA